MSRGDDDEDQPPSDRHIAIPGYRPASSSGARHRPPSVGRRSTGALPDVAPTRKVSAPPRAISAPPRPVSAPPRPVSAPPRPVSSPPRSASSPPRVSAPRASSGPDASARSSAAASASAVEPRGIEALQAEVARDDVRLLARQIAEGADVRSAAARPTPYTPGAWLRWRPHIAAALACLVLVVVAVPSWLTHSERVEAWRLPGAMAAAARTVAASRPAGEIASWIRERNLEALRTLYTEQRPAVVEMLHATGFGGVRLDDVTIRVDYAAETLVIGAQVELGDSTLTGAADLAGNPLGRSPPTPTMASSVMEHSGLLAVALALFALVCGLMWGGPALRARRG